MIYIEIFPGGIDITKGNTCYSIPWWDFVKQEKRSQKFKLALWKHITKEEIHPRIKIVNFKTYGSDAKSVLTLSFYLSQGKGMRNYLRRKSKYSSNIYEGN